MPAALPDLVIRASAGTGKTYQLTNRFISLLASGVPPEGILAATFTRKAAGEILERILLTLARAANDAGECMTLATAINAPELRQPRCVELLTQVTRRLHRLQVGTLDSFFAKLATSYSLELGLPPGWRILDDLEATRLKSDAIESLLESDADNDLVKLLRLLTKGAAARSVNELILDNVNACHEIAIETTPEAWQRIPCPPMPSHEDLRRTQNELTELAERADKGLQKAVAADRDFADREQWEEMLKKGILAKLVVGETTYNRKELDVDVRHIYDAVLAQVSAIALHRLAQQTVATRELLDRFDREFRELQRKHGGCGFSDVARALAGRRESSIKTLTGAANAKVKSDRDGDEESLSRLAFRMDSRLSHLLLDEFQDTSPLQWHVLRPFAEQVLAKQRRAKSAAQRSLFGEEEAPPSFFCVGDTKQAIYGWRGGDARIFDTLKKHLPTVKEETLAKSFRSAPPVIDAVNLVFTKLSQHPRLERLADAVASWCRLFPTHSTAKTQLPGYVQLRVASEATEDESQSDVTLRQAASLIADLSRQAPGRSIGVLARKNEVVGKLIYQLQALGIPASEEGGNPLVDSAAVRLILSLVRMADHPGDSVSRFHIATSPLGEALQFVDYRDESAAVALALSVRRALLVDGYGPSVAAWAYLLEPHCNRRERSRLEQLTEVAYAYQSSATLRPRDFVEHVNHIKVADPSSDLVRVMTVHQSKGLQFDIVVLPELDADLLGHEPTILAGNSDPSEPPDAVCLYRHANIQQLLPPALRRLFDQDVERRTHESLCVLYVALTRAIHGLYMLIAPTDKPPAKTFAGLLRASLADNAAAVAGSTLFEIGDLHWATAEVSRVEKNNAGKRSGVSSLVDSTKKRTTEDSAAAAPLAKESVSQIRFAPPLSIPVRGWRREAPSHHAAVETLRPLADLLQPKVSAARERGTLIHKWFEQIEWLNENRPSAESMLVAANQLQLMTLSPKSVLPDFFKMLEKPEIEAVLRRDITSQQLPLGCEPRVLREYPFACCLDQALISGVIDRLVLWSDADQIIAADLFDFKTDAVSGRGELWEARVANYRLQIETYRRAVSHLFGLTPDRISARLVFLQPGIVVSA